MGVENISIRRQNPQLFIEHIALLGREYKCAGLGRRRAATSPLFNLHANSEGVGGYGPFTARLSIWQAKEFDILSRLPILSSSQEL